MCGGLARLGGRESFVAFVILTMYYVNVSGYLAIRSANGAINGSLEQLVAFR